MLQKINNNVFFITLTYLFGVVLKHFRYFIKLPGLKFATINI